MVKNRLNRVVCCISERLSLILAGCSTSCLLWSRSCSIKWLSRVGLVCSVIFLASSMATALISPHPKFQEDGWCCYSKPCVCINPPCLCVQGCVMTPCQTSHTNRILRQRADSIDKHGTFNFSIGQEQCNQQYNQTRSDIRQWLIVHSPF